MSEPEPPLPLGGQRWRSVRRAEERRVRRLPFGASPVSPVEAAAALNNLTIGGGTYVLTGRDFGMGANGVVRRAWHAALGHDVAIKVIDGQHCIVLLDRDDPVIRVLDGEMDAAEVCRFK